MRLRQLALFVLFSSCYSTPTDITDCVGNDVNIPWVYPDSAGMSSVSWEYINASNVATTILLHFAGSPATVENSYNIRHNTNGNVSITTATVANNGTYRITVGYSSATPTFTDDVVINVHDPPTDFNFTESPSGSQKTFTCITSSLGVPAADLYIQVNGEDNTTSVSATVSEKVSVKCILSGPAVQCMSGVSGETTNLDAQFALIIVFAIAVFVYEWWQIALIPYGNSEWLGNIVGIILILTRKFFCNCFYYWKPKCCCICVWIWNCIFYRKFKCCCKCVWNVCDCCKNCNVKGLPCWYRILWLSVIGIPVALGILSVWIVYRIWCKNAIRYVLITNDGTSNKNDESWSLGASVGAFCVTKVTARGKLKVGDQMNKINGITVTGKNQNQILAMLNDKENLTLDVSQVGSVSTTDSVVELKREQLGFEYEYIAMVTNVTEGSKAEGKMEKGDLILSINGKSTAGKSNAEVNKELKKPEVMELSIKRGEDNKTIKLDLKENTSSGIAIKKEKEDIVVSTIELESAAAISGEIQVKDCILCVNGVSTAGLKVVEIEEMLTFSIILKVTKDVTVLELDSDLKGSIGVKNASANTVISVKAKGPAALAGIQEGDEIHKIDGKSTKTMTVKQIAKMIASREKTVIFESTRGEITVERDTNGSLGLELSSTPNVVYKVDGNAALSGKVKPGDTIVKINGKKTKGKSHQEIKTMLESSGGSISLKLKEAVTENGNPHRTSGHGEQGTGTCVLEMDHMNSSTQDSGRTLTPLQDGQKKHNLLKKEPLADIQPIKTT